MPRVRGNRRYGIVAASVAVHVGLLALVAVQSPRLPVLSSESGPPQAVIPILLMPRAPPAAANAGARPTEIRLHRRAQRFALEAPSMAPVVIPANAASPAAPVEGPRTTTPAPPPDPIGPAARTALRGKLGCASANLLGLSRAEREACEDQLAAGAKQAPFTGLGLNRDKARDLAAAGARRDADFRYKRGLPGPPVAVPPGAGWDGQRSPPKGAANLGMGATSEDLGATPAKIPF